MINRRIQLESTVARQEVLDEKIADQKAEIAKLSSENSFLRGLSYNNSVSLEQLRVNLKAASDKEETLLQKVTDLSLGIANSTAYAQQLTQAFGGLAGDLSSTKRTLELCMMKVNRTQTKVSATKQSLDLAGAKHVEAKKENLAKIKTCRLNNTAILDAIHWKILSKTDIPVETRKVVWRVVHPFYPIELQDSIEDSLAGNTIPKGII